MGYFSCRWSSREYSGLYVHAASYTLRTIMSNVKTRTILKMDIESSEYSTMMDLFINASVYTDDARTES